MSSSHTSSTAKSRSTSATGHHSTHQSVISQTAPPTPSKMKVFFHKVKKALKVDEEKALPPRLQHRYHKLKKYEAKLRKVYESIRVLLIRDPAEVKRAREKTTKGPFEPGEDSGIYQNLYRPLRKHKTLFSQYKNFDPIFRMVWDLGKLEREHQKATETIFAGVTRFLEEDCDVLENKMKTVYEAKEVLEFRKSQVRSGASTAEREMNRRLYDEAETNFASQCNEAKKQIKEMLRGRKEHGKAVAKWIVARAEWHKKMEQRMAQAGIAKQPWRKPEKKSAEQKKSADEKQSKHRKKKARK